MVGVGSEVGFAFVVVVVCAVGRVVSAGAWVGGALVGVGSRVGSGRMVVVAVVVCDVVVVVRIVSGLVVVLSETACSDGSVTTGVSVSEGCAGTQPDSSQAARKNNKTHVFFILQRPFHVAYRRQAEYIFITGRLVSLFFALSADRSK